MLALHYNDSYLFYLLITPSSNTHFLSSLRLPFSLAVVIHTLFFHPSFLLLLRVLLLPNTTMHYFLFFFFFFSTTTTIFSFFFLLLHKFLSRKVLFHPALHHEVTSAKEKYLRISCAELLRSSVRSDALVHTSHIVAVLFLDFN